MKIYFQDLRYNDEFANGEIVDGNQTMKPILNVKGVEWLCKICIDFGEDEERYAKFLQGIERLGITQITEQEFNA